MNPKTFVSLALLLALASCDKKPDSAGSGSNVESGPRTTRTDRPSRDVPGTRDKLRDALESARALESGEERNQSLAALAWKALDPAPDIAAQAIAELPAGLEEKNALIEAYVRSLMEEGKTDEALAWADALGDGRDVAIARGTIALLLAETAPEQAAALLPASGFTAAGVDPAAEQVLQTWVAKNPAEAVAWVTRLPAGEARTAGYKTVFSQWIGTDSAGAFSWVASQSNPHARREAVSAMVGVFAGLPAPIRDALLGPAGPELRAEIEQGVAGMAEGDSFEPEPSE